MKGKANESSLHHFNVEVIGVIAEKRKGKSILHFISQATAERVCGKK
jgi:hypothetical protein